MRKKFTKEVWTDAETNRLVELYADTHTRVLADIFQKSESKIYAKANRMGLKKSTDYMKMELDRQGMRIRELGAKSRFQKGQTPINKGVKMSQEVYEKVKHTMFKKNHEPVNTKYDGHERICAKDGYILIRVRKGKYVHKHRWIWENAHGAIPENHVVVFRDKNKLNLTIDNLELISRDELARRNKAEFDSMPEDLKGLIKIKNKLELKIKQNGKKNRKS